MRAYCPPSFYRACAVFLLLAAVSLVPLARARDFNLQWEAVWPRGDYLSGELYTAEGQVWVQNKFGTLRSSDGVTWRRVDDPDTVPADPTVTREFTLWWNHEYVALQPPEATGELMIPVFQDTYTAIWHQGLWWALEGSYGPSILAFTSPDGETWSIENLPGSSGLLGSRPGFELVESDGRLLYRNSYLIGIEGFGPPSAAEATQLFEYLDGEWIEKARFTGNSSSTVHHKRTFSVGGKAFFCLENATYPAEGTGNWYDPPAFTSVRRIAGQTVTGALLIENTRGHYLLTDTARESMPDMVPPPSESEAFTMAANSTGLWAAGKSGQIWRKTSSSSEWETVTTLDRLEGNWRTLRWEREHFSLLSEGFSFLSADGLNWVREPAFLPTKESEFKDLPDGHLAVETNLNSKQESVWIWDGTKWDFWRIYAPYTYLNFLPEVGLFEAYDFGSESHLFSSFKPGGRRIEWSMPGIVYRNEQNDIEVSLHHALIYGEGLYVPNRVEHSADSRLQFTELIPQGLDSRALAFLDQRFWVWHDGRLYRSQKIPPYPFDGAQISNNAWELSEWFGWVNTKDYPWVFHYPAGWIYVNGPDENNCWMWDNAEGWFWTSQYYWPTIWSKGQGWRLHSRMPSPVEAG